MKIPAIDRLAELREFHTARAADRFARGLPTKRARKTLTRIDRATDTLNERQALASMGVRNGKPSL